LSNHTPIDILAGLRTESFLFLNSSGLNRIDWIHHSRCKTTQTHSSPPAEGSSGMGECLMLMEGGGLVECQRLVDEGCGVGGCLRLVKGSDRVEECQGLMKKIGGVWERQRLLEGDCRIAECSTGPVNGCWEVVEDILKFDFGYFCIIGFSCFIVFLFYLTIHLIYFCLHCFICL